MLNFLKKILKNRENDNNKKINQFKIKGTDQRLGEVGGIERIENIRLMLR